VVRGSGGVPEGVLEGAVRGVGAGPEPGLEPDPGWQSDCPCRCYIN